MKKLNLNELIKFYDNRVPESLRMATAVNSVIGEEFAVALLVHYFESSGYEIEVLPGPCKGTANKGVRLDRWIYVTLGRKKILFQTEIKNWSSHSIGGRVIPACVEKSDLERLMTQNWDTRFDKANIPKEKQASKVLTRMSPPNAFSEFNLTPLICFWEAMHPEGKQIAYFQKKIENSAFKNLHIFSLSTYVRSLQNKGVSEIDVNLPNANGVLEWVNRIYEC
jgi:hypothetical protein